MARVNILMKVVSMYVGAADLGGSCASRSLLAARVTILSVLRISAPGTPGKIDRQIRLRFPPGKCSR